MHDELEQLLKLTKCFESKATAEEYEEDLSADIPTYDEAGNPTGALCTDDGDEDECEGKDCEKKESKKDSKKDDESEDEDSDEKSEKDEPEEKTDDKSDDASAEEDEGDKPESDGKPKGSSGNVIPDKSEGDESDDPIFELDDSLFEDFGVEEESIGLPSIKKEMKMHLTDAVERGMGHEFARKIKFEAANPLFVSNAPFKLGDVVTADGNPMLFVVKNNDGHMITAAKPTNNSADFCKCKDGCWPEFTFSQDEIKPMDKASLEDADYIAKFNDRFRGFDGAVEDRSPMERAQEYAQQQTIEDISQDLDEILGQYKAAAMGGDKDFTYTASSPTVVFRRPDGSVTTEQQMGGYQIKWGD